jgi:formate dehydrogenase major subunit
MVKLTIDGKTVEVSEGMTVLRAAEQAGIRIPTLCDHPELTPYGGCRLCLVEVEGARTLQPSCTLPASNNMVVRTDTEKVHSARKFVLTLLFSERNHFCPYCQVSGGDCALQNAALDEGMTHWPLSPNYSPFAVDASHPDFILDNNRCILCRRCVRACGELVGNFTLGFEERGARSFLVADFGSPLGSSTCVSCGTCIQVCPTGALIDRVSAYRGKVVQVDHHKTICVGCSLGCGIDVLTRDNNLVRIEGDWDTPVSSGLICKAGRFETQEVHGQRVATPLVRKNGVLKAATWDEALDVVANQLKPLAGQKTNGVAAVASTRLSAESLALFKQVFAGSLGSDLVTSIEEGQSTAVASALAAETGKSFEGSLNTVHDADVIIAFGADLVEDHQVAGFFVKRAIPNGAKLVVVDPAQNPFDLLAEHTLKPTSTADVDLIEALCAAVNQLGLAKKAHPAGGTLETLAAKAGVVVADLLEVARLVTSASKPAILYGKGITARGDVQSLKALVKFAEMVGVLTDRESRLVSLKGAANSLAAAQYGLDKPFQLNGHKAVFLALGDDKASKRLVQKLEKAPFMVVAAAYTSQLTAQADVVLPVTRWTEQEGHYLNLDGRLQKAEKALEPLSDVWTSEAVLTALAARLGAAEAPAWEQQLHQRVSPVAIPA